MQPLYEKTVKKRIYLVALQLVAAFLMLPPPELLPLRAFASARGLAPFYSGSDRVARGPYSKLARDVTARLKKQAYALPAEPVDFTRDFAPFLAAWVRVLALLPADVGMLGRQLREDRTNYFVSPALSGNDYRAPICWPVSLRGYAPWKRQRVVRARLPETELLIKAAGGLEHPLEIRTEEKYPTNYLWWSGNVQITTELASCIALLDLGREVLGRLINVPVPVSCSRVGVLPVRLPADKVPAGATVVGREGKEAVIAVPVAEYLSNPLYLGPGTFEAAFVKMEKYLEQSSPGWLETRPAAPQKTMKDPQYRRLVAERFLKSLTDGNDVFIAPAGMPFQIAFVNTSSWRVSDMHRYLQDPVTYFAALGNKNPTLDEQIDLINRVLKEIDPEFQPLKGSWANPRVYLVAARLANHDTLQPRLESLMRQAGETLGLILAAGGTPLESVQDRNVGVSRGRLVFADQDNTSILTLHDGEFPSGLDPNLTQIPAVFNGFFGSMRELCSLGFNTGETTSRRAVEKAFHDAFLSGFSQTAEHLLGMTGGSGLIPGQFLSDYREWMEAVKALPPEQFPENTAGLSLLMESIRSVKMPGRPDEAVPVLQRATTRKFLLIHGVPETLVRRLADQPPLVIVMRNGQPVKMPLDEAVRTMGVLDACHFILGMPELPPLLATYLRQEAQGGAARREAAGALLPQLFERSYPLFINTTAFLLDWDEPAALALLEAALAPLSAKFQAGPDAPDLVLGSSSARRQKLMREAGFRFRTETAATPETCVRIVSVEAASKAIAVEKLLAVALKLARAQTPPPRCPVLTADTMMINPSTDMLMGKPPKGMETEYLLRFLTRRVPDIAIPNITSVVCFDPATGRVTIAQDRAVLHLRGAGEKIEVRRADVLGALKTYLTGLVQAPEAPLLGEGPGIAARLLKALDDPRQDPGTIVPEFEAWLHAIYGGNPNLVSDYPVLAPRALASKEDVLRLTAGEFAALYSRMKSAGKSGGYGVQDADFRAILVTAVDGDIETIIGLPVARVRALLENRPGELAAAA